MSVLDRAALESSPLADLHTIASELSIDGYRRLRKGDLIERIIARQEGIETEAEPEETPAPADAGAEGDDEETEEASSASRRRRGRRGGRNRSRETAEAAEAADVEPADEDEAPTGGRAARGERSSRGERAGGRGRAGEAAGRGSESGARGRGSEAGRRTGETGGRAGEAGGADQKEQQPEEVVEGVVELLGNGSGFIRTSPPDPTDDDVYISAAQVKRCELVSGDRVTGPKRPPRRSERFPSLVRIDTINGRPAAELTEGARYDELPASFPTERFRLGSEDPTVKAIEFLTPFGRGSRVAIVGGPRAGKSHALRGLAEILSTDENTQLFVALAGVRPEEIPEWPREGALAPSAAHSFAASPDALDHLVELVIDQARRIAARGADAVVLIDTLDHLHPHAARKAMAAARNITDGGSLTVIATSTQPVGGETTVIALDSGLAAAGRYPALDLLRSGTLRPELLVGEAGAQAIAEAHSQALESGGQ